MSALDELTKKENWNMKSEYGPYGSYFVFEWVGGVHPDVDEAATQLSALHAAVAQAREAVQTARHWLFEVGASKEYSRELVETYLNMIDNELKKAG
jgi:hypothetical protein